MKRLALLYSGQPRHLKECHQNHFLNFHEANTEWQIDIFAHIWHEENMSGSNFSGKHKNRGQWDSDLIKFINEQWEPKKIVIEAPKEFSSNWKPDKRFPHPINNILSMFYSLEKANKLKKEYENRKNFKYDCVVRLRTDEFFKDKIGPINNYPLNTINVLDEFAHLSYGINDHFAFGNSINMDKFLNVYSNLSNIINEGSAINPETLLGWNALKYHKLEITKHKFNYCLWRDINNTGIQKSLLRKITSFISSRNFL